ncbi:MAG: helix-turn-helix transcriptional regulator [Rhodoferax sp.]|jgi:transcriptional regulator with XRE-family HTH domain|uniref:helix-turn-helix domain-containing protein n=1 Tax=Rhodoferax sp. TaxID=50421 RepID=UPI001B4D58A3|nr:helix-turn-helix transcriptional regulator [Rhodoferax sp.]MBP8285444.1 helix-turn-helix transcriptional regulator [Rhodoferax sp.]MBP9734298.1 helix-turn-helix transcriptional regulator [Rhodoferax sp.]
MPSSHAVSVVGRRMRQLRELKGWSQEKVGVAIGIDESSSRAKIGRYELGMHEPAVPTARLIATALGVPLTYLYCEDDGVAALLMALHNLDARERGRKVEGLLEQLAAA